MENFEKLIRNQGYKLIEVPISVSNRHAHLTEESLRALFGENYKLTKRNDLSQPGQFACQETVYLVTDKSKLICRVVGPTRNKVQVELSKTDAINLGINPPIRLSGDLENSASAKLIGPKGEYSLLEGIIIAVRHIHLSNEQASKYNLKNMDLVNLAVKSEKGFQVLGNVICRVGSTHYFDVHLDTDEANALGIKNGDKGFIFYYFF